MVDCDPYDPDQGGALVDAWIDLQWYEAVLCPYDLQVGSLVTGVFVFGAVSMGLYIRTGNAVIPLVALVLGGVVVISRIPSRVVQLIAVVLILGLAGAAYLVARRAQVVT